VTLVKPVLAGTCLYTCDGVTSAFGTSRIKSYFLQRCVHIEPQSRKPKDKKYNAETVFRPAGASQSVYTNGIVVPRTYNGGRGVKISVCL
jgi:hypothetical protein